jgi:hypothetical protein
MKSALCCFLLFAAGSCAQSTAKLDADLMLLANPTASRNAIVQQVADDIVTLAEKDSQPTRQTAFEFADELTKALAGHVLRPKPLSSATLQPVIQAIIDVLQSSGVPSYRFHAAIDHLRDGLILLGATAVQAKSAAGRLLILGQEVRGPEDSPPGRALIRSK